MAKQQAATATATEEREDEAEPVQRLGDAPELNYEAENGEASEAIEPDSDVREKKGKKEDDGDDLEYEVEWETPFGKIEFEFEPKAKKDAKDKKKREKQEREAAKAAKAAAKAAAEKAAERAKLVATQGPKGGGGGSRLLTVLVVFAVIAAAVALAYWLFARPGEEDEDAVPPEFRDDVPSEPQGFVAKAKGRVQSALRAGRSASREAQEEQRRKFEELAKR